VIFFHIQVEYKNTPWFQVVIKSKLTGIFLQNWWLQFHKLIEFHVVSHTLNVPLSLLSKHRCVYLARTKHSAAYPAWASWQLQWCFPAAHPRLRVVEVHRLCPSRTPKGIHIKFEFESTLHSHKTVCFMKFQHAPAALLWSERHLAFHCSLAAGGKIKNVLS